MMRPLAPLAAAAALLLAAAGAPAEALQAPVAADAKLERARLLSRLTNPFETMVDLNLAGWDSAAKHSMARDPAMTQLEAAYPGVSKAAVDAARPLARRKCEEFVRRMIEHKAKAYAERLTVAEMDEMIAFYETELGQRVLRQVLANADMDVFGRDIADRAAETGRAEVTTGSVETLERTAIRRTAGQLSAEDHLALLRVAQRPAAKKFALVRLEADRALIGTVNEVDPAWMREQTELVTGAVLAFIDAQKKR